jgi:simple sugar transport system ATP-binding protein
MTPQSLVEMRGIVKSFPGVRALDGVDFTLQRGEIHSLLGENGAGKSTLIKILGGAYRPNSGIVRLAGNAIEPTTPLAAQRLGISTVYQEINLIPELSVAENLFLGRQPRKFGLVHWRSIRRQGEALMQRLGLAVDVTRPLRSYSIAVQQMVAIARALDERAQVLVLDEPTSSLDAGEVQQLFSVMRRLRGEGLGIVFISHFLDQVYAISDRLTVLRNGKLVGEFLPAELPQLELIAKMLGQDVASVTELQSHRSGAAPAADRPALVRTRALGRRQALEPLDLEIRAGEVVGLAGLLGSGRTETARLLFGIDRSDGGEVEVSGQRLPRHAPRQSIRLGLALAPEDRKAEGIVPELSVRENIVLALQARRGWLRKIKRREERELVDRFIKALRIATPDAEKPVGQLSGGNQQKVILARWLAMQPKLLILDEPTRGIDVGAKGEIERLMAKLCGEGMALLFISSELEEVVRDSHRVVVLRDRRKVGELTGAEIDLPNIMRLIAAEHATTDA